VPTTTSLTPSSLICKPLRTSRKHC
jgi:hypothetical protein